MADGVEQKRAPAVPIRPVDLPPPADADLDEREDWAARFVEWFLFVTGGDPDIEGVASGHRWRMEYFECVRDPRAFEQYADKEIRAYAGGK